MELQRLPISTGWCFKQADSDDSTFLPVCQFPTTIHLDLMHHGKIVDPFLNANEAEVQWVGEETWIYRTKFRGPKPVTENIHSELVFEGLDTYVTIFLNSKEIQKTDNMYIEYRVDISNLIQKENELEIRFESTFLIGKTLEKEAKVKALFCHNGDSSRLQVRKAPYSYGWDWGPTMLTCGPWRPIYLETFTTRFKDLSFKVEISESLLSATITAKAELDGSLMRAKVSFQLLDPNLSFTEERIVPAERGWVQVSFHLHKPRLWYPIGNGPQPVYTLKAIVLSHDSTILCTSSKRIGIRRVRLVQRPLKNQPGTTFFFEVNNVPIFCRGADWIPADMFLPRVTSDRYREWIQLVANGNLNMIRVWGGGVYEDDIFYDICDELGILVWQDFMFGCGSYPTTSDFLKKIEEEAVYNIKRLRSHPCIVLWCGNNEDHMFADKYSSQYDVVDLSPDNWLKTDWPARIIYDKILKDLCQEHAPDVPYYPGSPWGGKPSQDSTIGDIHAWGVWMKASEQYPYQYYPKLAGRFVSEFGMKSYPTLKTVEEFITDPHERYPQSRMMDAHQKASSKSPWAPDNRTIALYMVENIKHSYKLPQYVYASQLIQVEAMSYAFSGWRRLWKGSGYEECAGALVWQLNDAWPCVSWALADYNIRPKLAYYAIKRTMADLIVGVDVVEIEKSRDSDLTNVHIHKEKRLQVWGSNFGLREEKAELIVQSFQIETGTCTWEKKLEVTLLENRSTELLDDVISDALYHTVFSARLLRNDKVIARHCFWPQPLRHLDLQKCEIKLTIEGDKIHASSSLPVKGLAIEVDDDAVRFDDNCIDLVPGDDQVIHAVGLNGRLITLMHLGIAAD